MSVFEKLSMVNVNDHTEKKGNLTYLSWAWAWAEVKKAFPDATYTVYENANGWNYHTDGQTCWVKTGMTIEGIEHIEYLPVMDSRNKSIPLESVTSFDVNKAIQRSLTKAAARHGLGLYIYAGEDLPDTEESKPAAAKKRPAQDTSGYVYPERMSMMKVVRAHYPDGSEQQAQLLDCFDADKLEQLTDAQLMAVWNKFGGR